MTITLDDLDNYRYIHTEIEALKQQIMELEDSYHSPAFDQTSHSSTPSNPTEKTAMRMIELEARYTTKFNELIELQKRIEEWLESIDNNEVSTTIRWHYMIGLNWSETSKKVNGYPDYYASRKLVMRFFGKE